MRNSKTSSIRTACLNISVVTLCCGKGEGTSDPGKSAQISRINSTNPENFLSQIRIRRNLDKHRTYPAQPSKNDPSRIRQISNALNPTSALHFWQNPHN